MARVIHGRPLVAGAVSGTALVSDEPLSFWGGYAQDTGEIIDRRHPLSSQIATGRVLALPASRGSSTTTAVLLEAVRLSTAPCAIVTNGVDSFFALAAIVADELYGRVLPVVALDPAGFDTLRTGDWIQIRLDGSVIVQRK